MKDQDFHIVNSSSLCIQVNTNGAVRRMDHNGILINLFPGNEIEGGPANIYLRRPDVPGAVVPLLGPQSPAVFRFEDDGVFAQGQWEEIRFQLTLMGAAAEPAWFWHVGLQNRGSTSVVLDLIYTQD